MQLAPFRKYVFIIFIFYFFVTSCCFLWHRLLCHSLVRSELYSSFCLNHDLSDLSDTPDYRILTIHLISPNPRSDYITWLPSNNLTKRCVFFAMFSSCVTITMVVPSFSFKRINISIISLLMLLSRFPVGSSARIISG